MEGGPALIRMNREGLFKEERCRMRRELGCPTPSTEKDCVKVVKQGRSCNVVETKMNVV